MDILNKFKENLKKEDLKDKTVKNYTSDLNTVLDVFDYSDDFLKTPEASIKKLEEHYPNIKTLATKINIIIMLFQLNYKDNEPLKKFYDEYVEYRNQLRVENEEYYKLKIANPKQLEQAISNEEIDTIKTVLLSRVKHSIKNRLELNALRDYIFFCFKENTKWCKGGCSWYIRNTNRMYIHGLYFIFNYWVRIFTNHN